MVPDQGIAIPVPVQVCERDRPAAIGVGRQLGRGHIAEVARPVVRVQAVLPSVADQRVAVSVSVHVREHHGLRVVGIGGQRAARRIAEAARAVVVNPFQDS